MAGARAQHPLGNRETPRIAAGISPIGGASGQRLRRYFFGASPPGEGGAGNNAKKPGATEGAGNNAGTAMPEMPDNAARHANRQVASTCRTGGGQRASHSRKQAAGDGQQAAGGTQQKAESRRRAGSNPPGSNPSGRRQHRASRRFHVHTNSPQRPQMHTPARRQSPAQGIGDRFGTVQTRLRQKSCRQTGTIHRDTGNPPNKGNTADVHKLS